MKEQYGAPMLLFFYVFMDIKQLFLYYYRPLCLYALHYVSHTDVVEDLVQECFIKLIEKQPIANEKAYLYTAVRNACIDYLRKKNPLSSDIQPTDLDDTINDEEAAERSLHEAELWTAIDTLPERCRIIFLMTKRDGMTYHEIAEKLHISEKTVEHQISKAIKQLRKKSGDYFYLLNLV